MGDYIGEDGLAIAAAVYTCSHYAGYSLAYAIGNYTTLSLVPILFQPLQCGDPF